jgi:hypothetical protein
VSELFETGRIIDLLLVFLIMEAAFLGAYRRISGRGVPTRALAANLVAGGCLLLAVRAALTGAGWEWVGAWLAASLIAHVNDLRRRWTR